MWADLSGWRLLVVYDVYIFECVVLNVYEQRNWNVKRTALCQEHIAVVYIFATCTIDGIVNGVKILYIWKDEGSVHEVKCSIVLEVWLVGSAVL